MAIARWKLGTLEGCVVWGVYDDVTQEISGFEIQNPGRKRVRLIVTRTGEPDEIVDRNARQPAKVEVETPGVGKRIVSRDGEVDLPVGLSVIVETRPR